MSLRGSAVVLATATLMIGGQYAAGQQPPPRYQTSWRDGAAIAAAGLAFGLPSVLRLPRGGPSCAPCDPAGLIAVDRWAVHPISAAAGYGSDVALTGTVAFGAYAAVIGLPREQWRGNLVVLAEAASWTAASGEWLKVLIRRKRPILYTSDASAAVRDRDSQMSLPSGHASIAFAAATSYLVIARRQHLAHRTRNAILLYAGALGVSALRVAAGKHFPTDLLASAGLGIGIGWVLPATHK